MAGKLIKVQKRDTGSEFKAELLIAGRILDDAGIKPGDSVAVEVVEDGVLKVRRVA